jgi:FkbM family methyltransferase
MIRRLIFVARMVFGSFSIWPLRKWIGIWFGPISNVTLNGYTINIRTNRITTKIADLAVAWEVFVDNVYDSFAICNDDIILDIGGHIGSFTTKAANKCPNGKIYTFEPTPDTFSILGTNVKYLKNVEIFRTAISDHTGTEKYYLSENNPGENSLFRKTNKQTTVDLITLQDFFSKFGLSHVNLMKLDCEGAEYSIVTSSIAEIKKKVEKIVMEVHEPKYFDVPSEYTIHSLIEILQSAGFEVNFRRENQFQGYIYAKNLNFSHST